MVQNFLKPSYKRYKEDTDRFAFWLVSIAKKCGLQPDSNSATAGNPVSNAKAQGKAKPKYLATASELLRLGQAIANSSVHVPASILALGRRAIQLRKHVTSHFLGTGDAASNERHSHFILVLENICDALEWESKPTISTTDKNTGNQSVLPAGAHDKKVDAQAWLNRFAALTVEELEELDDIPELIKVEVIEDEEVPENDGADTHLSHAFFMLFCLFHDLKNFRAFIAQTWTEYRDLKIDLMTASIVTDNALQLAQDLAKEVVDNLPRELSSRDLDIQIMLYKAACVAHGVIEPPTHGLTFNVKMADFADWYYIPTATLLQSFIPVIQDGSIPVYKPGYFGIYNPKADRASMTVVERFNEDKLILLELLPEFCMMNMFNFRLPAADEITKGFVKFARDRKATLWLSFAAQIFLDIHHITRSSRLNAFVDLRICGLRISRTIEDFWELSKTHPKPLFWPQKGDSEIGFIHECVETFIEHDPLLVMREAAAEELSRPKQGYPDHFLFRQNSVLCGLTMAHLNFRMQIIGQSLVNQWYDVQQLAFLYNLFEQMAGPTLVWPDMEMFIKIHGENRVFVGDRPKNAAQSLNRLEMATGISSVTRFARDSRRKDGEFHRPDGNRGTARLLVPTTKVANLFRDRYTSVKSIRVISSVNVERFLDELSDEAKTTTKRSDKGKRKGELALPSEPEQLLGRKWSSTHSIGPLQLLALIKTKLCEEEPVILFNYFGMHKRSIEMLRLIRAKEHHKFVQYFTSRYMPDESMISNLVMLIHYVARGSAQSGAQMGLATGSGETLISRLVMSCGEVMKDYLEKNGNVACKELRVYCKNKAQLEKIMEGDRQQSKVVVDDRAKYWFTLEDVLSSAELASIMTGIQIT